MNFELVTALMSSVAKKRRRPRQGLTYYDHEDDDSSIPKRRTTDSRHLHTSITATSSGISTRTRGITAADPRQVRLSANTTSCDVTSDRSIEYTSLENGQEDDEYVDIFESLDLESFTDIHDFIDIRKIRKRTTSVREHFKLQCSNDTHVLI